MRSFEELVKQLKSQFPTLAIEPHRLAPGDPWVQVSPAEIRMIAFWLRDASECRFDTLLDLTAIDWLTIPGSKSPVTEPRIEVVYQLTSLELRHRLTLKCRLERWTNGIEGELPSLPSVVTVWKAADWLEREVFDMFGVRFEDHPDLRRILCAEDWEGYPLRKDYVFPLEYHGIRGR